MNNKPFRNSSIDVDTRSVFVGVKTCGFDAFPNSFRMPLSHPDSRAKLYRYSSMDLRSSAARLVPLSWKARPTGVLESVHHSSCMRIFSTRSLVCTSSNVRANSAAMAKSLFSVNGNTVDKYKEYHASSSVTGEFCPRTVRRTGPVGFANARLHLIDESDFVSIISSKRMVASKKINFKFEKPIEQEDRLSRGKPQHDLAEKFRFNLEANRRA